MELSSLVIGDHLWRFQPVLKVHQSHLHLQASHNDLCRILRRNQQTISVVHQGDQHLRRSHGMCLTSRRRTTSLVPSAELEQMLGIRLDHLMTLLHFSRNWLKHLLHTIDQPLQNYAPAPWDASIFKIRYILFLLYYLTKWIFTPWKIKNLNLYLIVFNYLLYICL